MRLFRLVLLCLAVYLVTIVWLFPAAPVVEKIRPMVPPLELAGVEGRVLNGSVRRVTYDDGVLPVELSNLTWRLALQKLFTGAAGVNFTFDAYGGQGQGLVAQRFNGDIDVTDVTINAQMKELESLLPLPIAQFTGRLLAQIEAAEIRNRLLSTFRGKVAWSNAVLEQPIRANLGNIQLDVKPIDDLTHRGFLKSANGELGLEGTVDIKQNGDFKTDITVTPSDDATPEVLSALRGLGRPDQSGRYRIRQNGNVNRLM
ncbi:MAG: type II secretion system protein N [Gammaproteobacteria bacterium]|nr:type II secretion system protein N [Gammaproteobacteria bacterium]